MTLLGVIPVADALTRGRLWCRRSNHYLLQLLRDLDQLSVGGLDNKIVSGVQLYMQTYLYFQDVFAASRHGERVIGYLAKKRRHLKMGIRSRDWMIKDENGGTVRGRWSEYGTTRSRSYSSSRLDTISIFIQYY